MFPNLGCGCPLQCAYPSRPTALNTSHSHQHAIDQLYDTPKRHIKPAGLALKHCTVPVRGCSGVKVGLRVSPLTPNTWVGPASYTN